MGIQQNFTRVQAHDDALLDPAELGFLENGMVMCYSATPAADGTAQVHLPLGDSTDVVAGFLQLPTNLQQSVPFIEELTIPASSPFTLTLRNLPIDSAVAVSCFDKTAGTFMTFSNDGTPATGEFDITGKVVTFNSAQASHSIKIIYRYLCSADYFNQFGQWSINSGGTRQYGLVTLLKGKVEIYTSCFDCGARYLSGPPSQLELSATTPGFLTLSGTGAGIDFGRCTATPILLDTAGVGSIPQAFICVEAEIP